MPRSCWCTNLVSLPSNALVSYRHRIDMMLCCQYISNKKSKLSISRSLAVTGNIKYNFDHTKNHTLDSLKVFYLSMTTHSIGTTDSIVLSVFLSRLPQRNVLDQVIPEHNPLLKQEAAVMYTALMYWTDTQWSEVQLTKEMISHVLSKWLYLCMTFNVNWINNNNQSTNLLKWSVTILNVFNWLVGWLCFTSHLGHLETAPLFNVPCKGREAWFLHRSHQAIHYTTTAPHQLHCILLDYLYFGFIYLWGRTFPLLVSFSFWSLQNASDLSLFCESI